MGPRAVATALARIRLLIDLISLSSVAELHLDNSYHTNIIYVESRSRGDFIKASNEHNSRRSMLCLD